MIRLYDRLNKELPEAKMILQVHDELVVEVPLAMKEQAEAIMREEMEGAVSLEVPLTVDIGSGPSWYQAHEL